MRRISLALALMGAVAAAGCGGGAQPSSTAGNKGTAGSTFTVTVNNQGGGTVSDGTNTCAANTTCNWTYAFNTAATLTASAGSLYFNGWFGDCSGTDTCAIAGNADKYIVAYFSTSPQGHPNWAAGHGAQLDLRCTNCHGAQLAGAGIAPSCSSCHESPFGKHFDPTAAAWSAHGSPGTGWTQACERCHNAKGYQDYVGADGVANNLSGSFDVDQILTTDTAAGAYNVGTLVCKTCHNSASDPTTATVINQGPPVTVTQTGVQSILFPSLIQQTTNHVSGLCGTCHQARESTASEASKINAKVAAASQGLGIVTVSGATTGSAGTTTTLVTGKVTVAANQYVGYTAIFSGSVTPALNGVKAVVTGNTAAANAATTLSFASLPAAPAFTTLPLATSPSADGASLYPTATAGTTTTLVDGNRAWTAGAWTGFYVFFMTGANAGKYAAITANDATSLTFAAVTTAPAPGDYYLIVNESPAVLDAAIAGFSWNNPHYLGAAATLYGSTAAGWYQYPVTYDATPATKSYNPRESFHEGAASVSSLSAGSFTYTDSNNQVQTYSWAANAQNVNEHKCTYCHNAHTLEVTDLSCATAACHHHKATNPDGSLLNTMSWLKGNKPASSDWDGNGTTASTHDELEGLKVIFLQAIQAYAQGLGNTNGGTSQLCFNDANYSYWFVATAADLANGTCNSTTGWAAAGTNTVWTPRLARATYNYKFAMKDPGAWAHNPKYAAQIMYDAIKDLNAGLVAAGKTPVAFAGVRP
jgi:hypothetical protein